MKRLWLFAAMAVLFAAFQFTPAYADLVGGAEYAFSVAIPLLLVALFIIATALIIRAIRKRKNKK